MKTTHNACQDDKDCRFGVDVHYPGRSLLKVDAFSSNYTAGAPPRIKVLPVLEAAFGAHDTHTIQSGGGTLRRQELC